MSARKARPPKSGTRGHARPAAGPRATGPSAPARQVPVDRFFRDVVASMRNGVVTITRDGRIAFINEVACRTLGCKVTAAHLGRPFFDVLKNSPDIVRILAEAFDLSTLPNRAKLRLKPSDKVIGYTLSHVRDKHKRKHNRKRQ